MCKNITNVTDIIIEAKGFLPLDNISSNDLKRLDRHIEIANHFMVKEGYIAAKSSSPLTKTFIYTINPEFRRIVEEESFEEAMNEVQKELNDLLPSIPFRISVLFSILEKYERDLITHDGSKEKIDALTVIIRSEPLALYQLKMIPEELEFSSFDISDIIETNIQFIREMMYATSMIIIENPAPIKKTSEIMNTQKFNKLGFGNIISLLMSAKEKNRRRKN